MKWIILIGTVLMMSGCFCLNPGTIEYRPQSVAVIPVITPVVAPPIGVPVVAPVGVPVVAPVGVPVVVPVGVPVVAPVIEPVLIYRYPSGPLRYLTTSIDYY